ncbi:hypothetical protein HUU05_01650 [candidate division KSB1 bacterium]|nr:hypothetical protein [candidate division KSB1 bacterium]
MNKPSSSQKRKTTSDYDAARERFSQRKDKVAESLAVYTPTRTRRVPSGPRHIAGIAASEEVWRFAWRNDLITHLETAVRLAKENFKPIEGFHFTYDIDPEIENESYITIRANVQGTVKELLPKDWSYSQTLVRTLPKDKLHLIHFSPTVG